MVTRKNLSRLTEIGPHFRTIWGNTKYKRTVVVCFCKCGNYVAVRVDEIKSNNTLSCGCLNNELRKTNRKRYNFTKEELYELYINQYMSIPKIAKHIGCSVSTIKCYLYKYSIPTRNVGGYIGDKSPYWKGCGDLSGEYWNEIRKGARKRSLEFDITIEFVWELFKKQNRACPYTGEELVLVKSLGLDRKLQTASLDRINNDKGYIKSNVQWVHKQINMMKYKYTSEELVELCCKVADHSRK